MIIIVNKISYKTYSFIYKKRCLNLEKSYQCAIILFESTNYVKILKIYFSHFICCSPHKNMQNKH